MVLAIRTDKPTAELYVLRDGAQLNSCVWTAHKTLSVDIHTKIKELLASEQATFNSLKGIIFYEGPGSFTGLRIGASVVNALGSALQIPVVAAGTDDWLQLGQDSIAKLSKFTPVAPLYGSEAFITAPKK